MRKRFSESKIINLLLVIETIPLTFICTMAVNQDYLTEGMIKSGVVLYVGRAPDTKR